MADGTEKDMNAADFAQEAESRELTQSWLLSHVSTTNRVDIGNEEP